jgi:NitT/TauT family transport system substrate-binding protein
MKTSNKFLIIVLSLVFLGVLFSSIPLNYSQAIAAEPVKAKVAILTWVGYGPFFVAKERGFFKKHGVDIDIVKIEELGARHSALISGAVQFSISTLDLFANEAPQGLPAVCVVKLTDSYGADGIVAKKSIRSIKDLKGKTVAFEKGTPSHFFLLYLLEKDGLSLKDIIPKYMTAGDAGAAFIAGHVDAAVTWEPWLTKAKETPYGDILVTSRERPGLLLDILLVHTSFAREYPEAVKGVLLAWFEAIEYWQKNPNDANVIMAKGLGLSQEEFAVMLKGDQFSDYQENRRYFGLDTSEPGPFFEAFDQAQHIWLREGLIKNTVISKDVADIAFLRDLYK